MGNYRLIKLLGIGGFAEVYRGEHVYLGGYAAVKVLTAQLTDEEIAKFLLEARTTRNLSHPNIIPILDFGMDGRQPFTVMAYAVDGTLRQRHPKGSSLPLSTVVSYIKQVAAALQHAHNQKMIHRDVKPENMLIGPNNEIVLSDFGIAVVAHSTRSQRVENVIETWTYAAPEQFRGVPHPATDQYALAIVAYEWLCGTPPFQGDFPMPCYHHMQVPPPSLQQKMPTLSLAVEQVVMRALAKDLKQRFPTIQEFANSLEVASQSPSLPKPSKLLKPPIPSPGTTLLTYRVHSNWVRAVAWSPDGRLLASASDDKTVQVWEASSGQRQMTYGGYSSYVRAVAWSPNSRLLASTSGDKTVQVWEASSGQHRLTYDRHSSYVRAVAWSPDGRHLASAGDDRTVQVWESSSGKHLLTYDRHSSGVGALAWSPDSHLIASASDDHTVQVWDAGSGKRLLIYEAHSKSVTAVAWSPDGQRIASASGDKTVQVWQAV